MTLFHWLPYRKIRVAYLNFFHIIQIKGVIEEFIKVIYALFLGMIEQKYFTFEYT